MIKFKLEITNLIALLCNFPCNCYCVGVVTFCSKLLSSIYILKELLHLTEKQLFEFWVIQFCLCRQEFFNFRFKDVVFMSKMFIK